MERIEKQENIKAAGILFYRKNERDQVEYLLTSYNNDKKKYLYDLGRKVDHNDETINMTMLR